ncbi:MAG: nucleotide sugar dehydrogenase [Planctomycetes bacterium]|nr:nucleotide sugar dehydrogenase [Planctomycetota bacterium]
MGYVGLPLVRTFCAAGFKVVGVDIDPDKVKQLSRGKSYIKHIPSSVVRNLLKKEMFKATTDGKALRRCSAILVCVPTPLTKMREPDMSYVCSTMEMISKHIKKGQLVVLESTTYPGTTRELIMPLLQRSGLKADKDFFLAYSPEREDPGRVDFTTETIPKLVGGIGRNSLRAAVALYRAAITKTVPVSSCEVAECAKILENVYRCVNIALINEMKVLLDRMGIDVWEVVDAAATKPFGFQPFYPGPGLGGHCIPIDPFYLTWRAREFGMVTRFIELSGEINTAMPEYVVNRVAEALNDMKKPVKGSKILVLGLAYKKDVDDIRESPAVALIELLQARGAAVDYNDPHVPGTHKQREHDLGLRSKKLSASMLRSYDCVLIATDHSAYDFPWIVKHAKLIVDTRNATARCKTHRSKIVKA